MAFFSFSYIPTEQLVPLAIVFILFFAIIYFLLSRSVFKENATISGIIAAAVSALIVWGTKDTLLYNNLFSSLNLGEYSLFNILIIGIIVIILASYKNLEAKGIVIALGLVGVLLYFLPNILNDPYILPYWVTDYGTLLLIAGIALVAYGIFGVHEKPSIKIR